MGKIKILASQYSPTSATSETNLLNAHMKDPAAGYDKIIQYAEKRNLMTFLVSGVTNGKYTAAGLTGKDTASTKIGVVPQAEMISENAWKYRIQGRIQKSCVIMGTSAVGTVTTGSTISGGYFNLKLKDSYLKIGMNVVFYNKKIARVMTQASPSGGGFLYTFQCYPGDTFTWADWVGAQPGTKTCFGAFTTYGERSLKGYDVQHFPESFINHMTIQRKGFSISGDANAVEIVWYMNNGIKGWVYEQEQQSRARFNLEDDYQKKWSKSTMKDSNGNLLDTPSMTDHQTGEPIVSGDGLYEQIDGANNLDASGTDGEATYEDFSDMLKQLKKYKNQDGGNEWYFVTGTEGMSTANKVIHKYAKDIYNFTMNANPDGSIGGNSPAVGFNFTTMDIDGERVIFVLDPMQDDEQKFPKKTSNGKSEMSQTYYCLDMSTDFKGRRNIEIRARGREGVNRNFVYCVKNGMTGEGKAMDTIDAKSIDMLKQNLIVAYNTKSCGIIRPPATA